MTALSPAFLLSASATPAAVHAYRLAARQDNPLALAARGRELPPPIVPGPFFHLHLKRPVELPPIVRGEPAAPDEFLASREVDAKLLKSPARPFHRAAEAAFVAKVARLKSERGDPPVEPLALTAD